MFDQSSFMSFNDHASLPHICQVTAPLHTDQLVEIYSVKTLEVARILFGTSKWCVKENPWFKGYIDSGPLLFLRSFKRHKDYLLAPAHGEFRNSRNRRISLPIFIDEHPSIALVLRGWGVFWHNSNENISWRDDIHYCPPFRRKSHPPTIVAL